MPRAAAVGMAAFLDSVVLGAAVPLVVAPVAVPEALPVAVVLAASEVVLGAAAV